MNDNITVIAPSLSDFLARTGLPQAARDRVIEVDRILAVLLASGNPDAEGCAALAMEAADLIAGANLLVFDRKG